jgi:hypothetical protein
MQSFKLILLIKSKLLILIGLKEELLDLLKIKGNALLLGYFQRQAHTRFDQNS